MVGARGRIVAGDRRREAITLAIEQETRDRGHAPGSPRLQVERQAVGMRRAQPREEWPDGAQPKAPPLPRGGHQAVEFGEGRLEVAA